MAFPGVGAIAHIRSLCEPAVRKTLEVHQPCQLRFLRMRFWANGTTQGPRSGRVALLAEEPVGRCRRSHLDELFNDVVVGLRLSSASDAAVVFTAAKIYPATIASQPLPFRLIVQRLYRAPGSSARNVDARSMSRTGTSFASKSVCTFLVAINSRATSAAFLPISKLF
jgi:hypothetical protein